MTTIGILLLTIVLAAATVWYAKSANDQVDELVRARLATIKPRVPVVSASHGGKPGRHLDGLVIKADIKNMGGGPAIDVLAKLEHEPLKIASVTGLATLSVGLQQAVSFVVSESSTDLGYTRADHV